MTLEPRDAGEIQAQIAEFRASLPANADLPPPADDFAACVQWEAWQNHIKSLETELVTTLFAGWKAEAGRHSDQTARNLALMIDNAEGLVRGLLEDVHALKHSAFHPGYGMVSG